MRAIPQRLVEGDLLVGTVSKEPRIVLRNSPDEILLLNLVTNQVRLRWYGCDLLDLETKKWYGVYRDVDGFLYSGRERGHDGR